MKTCFCSCSAATTSRIRDDLQWVGTMATTRTNLDGGTPLGANIAQGGVMFRVWAPAAQQMFVLSGAALTAAEQPGFTPSQSDTMFRLGDGTWGAFVPGLGEGARYRFWVIGAGSTGFKR